MEIREFRYEDAGPVSALIEQCFLTLDLGGHTEQGKRLQIAANSPENLLKRAQSVRYFVVCEGDRLLGICGYDRHKVQTLFVDVDHHHQGIGKALLQKILSEAANDGLSRIDTWATIYSEPFYEAFGFQRIEEIHFPDGGNDIVLVFMRKQLP